MKDLATMGTHAAEVFLERRGFGIIECPYKDADSDGPIDIIAEDEGSMVFVAVKCRKDGDSLPTYEPDREELESFQSLIHAFMPLGLRRTDDLLPSS